MFILGLLCRKYRMSMNEAWSLTPGDTRTITNSWDAERLWRQTQQMFFTKELGENEFVQWRRRSILKQSLRIKSYTTVHTKNLALPIVIITFLWKHLAKTGWEKRKLFCFEQAGSCWEEMKTWASYWMSVKRKGQLYVWDNFFPYRVDCMM